LRTCADEYNEPEDEKQHQAGEKLIAGEVHEDLRLFIHRALPKKSKQSAKGAKYESQGQARSEAERVAPGERKHLIQR
jgi:hypothetical protein